jgi:pectate lyase
MKKIVLFSTVFALGFAKASAQDTLIIQENEPGLCTFDGTVMTNLSGWSGTGYIDIGYGIGAYISYEIAVPSEGIYALSWRYAFNGTPRDARLLINGSLTGDTVLFPSTGSSSAWFLSAPVNVHLGAGDNKIRIEALFGTANSGGLGNIDYFMVIGNAPAPNVCSPQYSVTVSSNNLAWGTASYSPVQILYNEGTSVTLHASANPGYFFQCWMGDETSADSAHPFAVERDVHAVARFLPNATKLDSSIIGYATVEDDRGTPYWVTGGALGDTVSATTVAELQTYLGDSLPRVVKFSGWLTGTEQIGIKSDKTLLGIGDSAHFEGIGLSINQARNVIIRNISVAHVCTTGAASGDAVEINGASQNIVIDHCELSSDRDHDKDYYDGLLDIKNQSSFISVSWSAFHDHYKVSLISSGPTQYGDTVIRATYHHNYFYNCGSRLPSIRFGKAHVFNNYYKDCDDAVHSRIGAWVRVEGNYFSNVDHAVDNDDTSGVGYVQLIDNHFGSSVHVSSPTCDLPVPYAYALDPADSIPSIIAGGVRTDVESNTSFQLPFKFALDQNFPNPFNPRTVIGYQLPVKSPVNLKVYDILGREVITLVDETKTPGSYVLTWNAASVPSGIYFCRFVAGGFIQLRKLVLVK